MTAAGGSPAFVPPRGPLPAGTMPRPRMPGVVAPRMNWVRANASMRPSPRMPVPARQMHATMLGPRGGFAPMRPPIDTGITCPQDLVGRLLEGFELGEISADCGARVALAPTGNFIASGSPEAIDSAKLHIRAWLDVNAPSMGPPGAPVPPLGFPPGMENVILPAGFPPGMDAGFPPGMDPAALSDGFPPGMDTGAFPPGLPPDMAMPVGFPPGFPPASDAFPPSLPLDPVGTGGACVAMGMPVLNDDPEI